MWFLRIFGFNRMHAYWAWSGTLLELASCEEELGEEGITKWLESGEVFMLKSCKFCDLLLTLNIHAFVPALLLFISDTVWIFLKRVQLVQQSAVKRVNLDNFPRTQEQRKCNSLRSFLAGKVNVKVCFYNV